MPFLVAVSVATAAIPQSPQSAAEKARELQRQLNAQRNKKQKLRQELQKTNRRINVVVGDIKWVDNRLGDLEDELQATAKSLDQNRTKQKILVRELAKATVELADVTKQTRQRLRRIYTHGPTSFLSVLAGTEGVGDMVSRKVLMDSIEHQDRRVFNAVKRLRAEVADKKVQQDRTVAAIQRYENQQKAQQEDLNDAREEKSQLLGNLKDQRAQQMAMVKQFEEDERSITAQIAEYLRRARANQAPGTKLPAFTGRFSRPVNAPITSKFGNRYHPILHINRPHTGIDFGAHAGTPIGAAADGIIISTNYMRGYGNTIIIDHGGGYATLYGHCSRIFVRSGQHVKRGEHVGAVGATGLATAPHLHFEVLVNGHPVNPLGKL